MFNKSLSQVAVIVGAVLASSAARAEDQLLQKPERNLHQEFEKARKEAAKTAYHAAPRNPVTSTVDVDMPFMLERVVDGYVLVSEPYDPAYEALLEQGGFVKARSRAEATDKQRFDGRIFRMYRVGDANISSLERLVGQEVILTVKVDNNELALVTGARVRR